MWNIGQTQQCAQNCFLIYKMKNMAHTLSKGLLKTKSAWITKIYFIFIYVTVKYFYKYNVKFCVKNNYIKTCEYMEVAVWRKMSADFSPHTNKPQLNRRARSIKWNTFFKVKYFFKVRKKSCDYIHKLGKDFLGPKGRKITRREINIYI